LAFLLYFPRIFGSQISGLQAVKVILRHIRRYRFNVTGTIAAVIGFVISVLDGREGVKGEGGPN
jgi:hypothetical protein